MCTTIGHILRIYVTSDDMYVGVYVCMYYVDNPWATYFVTQYSICYVRGMYVPITVLGTQIVSSRMYVCMYVFMYVCVYVRMYC